MKTVYIGVIPGVRNLAGVLFRTDLSKMYHTELSGAKYSCEINGGRNRYFFIEERFWIEYPGTNKKSHVGNIKQIHHFNKDNEKQEQETRQGCSNGIEAFGWCVIGAFAIALLIDYHRSRAESKVKRSKQGASSKTGSGNTTQNAGPKETPKRRILQLPGRKNGRKRRVG